MTVIDYEHLGKAVRRAGTTQRLTPISEHVARAVVAALGDQGLVVVRADDIDLATTLMWINGTREDVQMTIPPTPVDAFQAARRLLALAAPGDGGEETG